MDPHVLAVRAACGGEHNRGWLDGGAGPQPKSPWMPPLKFWGARQTGANDTAKVNSGELLVSVGLRNVWLDGPFRRTGRIVFHCSSLPTHLDALDHE